MAVQAGVGGRPRTAGSSNRQAQRFAQFAARTSPTVARNVRSGSSPQRALNSAKRTAAIVNTHSPTYKVQSGQTLSQIARSMGTSVDALAKANGISNPNLIKIGQTLKNPNVAKQADRLASSAVRASPTVAAINRAGVSPQNAVKTAQMLKVAAAAAAKKASAAKPASKPASRISTAPTKAVAAPVKAAVAPVKAAPKPVVAAPKPTTVQGSGTAAKATTLSGRGTFGKFKRQREGRGPMTGESLTPEQLQAIARQRIVNYH